MVVMMMAASRENLRGEGACDVFFGEDFLRFAAGDQFAVYQEDMVEDFGHGFQVMVRRDDQFACLAEPDQSFNERRTFFSNSSCSREHSHTGTLINCTLVKPDSG